MINTFSTKTFELSSGGRKGMNLMFFPEVISISDSTITLKKKQEVVMVKLYEEGEESMDYIHIYNKSDMNHLKKHLIKRLALEFKATLKEEIDIVNFDEDVTKFLENCSITVFYEMLETFKDAIYYGLIEEDRVVLELMDQLPTRDAW